MYPALSLLVGKYIIAEPSINITKQKINNIVSNLLYIVVISALSYTIFISMKNYSSFIKSYSFTAIIIFLIYLSSIIVKARVNKLQCFYYQVFLGCFTSIFIFGFLLPKLDKIWVTQNIYNIIYKDNNAFKSKNIATIGYNEPSLIFVLGTDTTVLRSLKEDFFEKKRYRYIIVEKKYLYNFNNILKDNNYEYVLLKEIEGFNMAKSNWVNTFIFKLKEE